MDGRKKVVTSAGGDVVGLEVSCVERGIRTTEEEFGTFGSELERKNIGFNGTRRKGVVDKGELPHVGEGWVRQTQQSKA
jgi:hypothetical protein